MKPTRVPGVLLVLATLSAYGASADPIEVAGRVRTADDAPLAEARLTLTPYEDPLLELRGAKPGTETRPIVRGLTDPAGRYRLEAPYAGLWTLRVEAPGFAPLEAALRPLVEPVVLEDARLVADAGLAVQVLDPAGKPVSGASVAVAPERAERFARPTWEPPRQRGRTGEDGRVTFALGERVAVRVSVLAEGFPLRELAGHRGAGARIPLGRGSTRSIEIVTADGRPVAGALVAAGAEPHLLGVSDGSGRIALAVEPGASFAAAALHDDGRRIETRIGPAPADEALPLRLVLPERHSLVGRLIDAESRRPVSGGVIWDQRDPRQAARTDSAGTFVYGGPVGARLELSAAAPGYLKSEPFEIQLEDDGRPGPTLPLEPAAAIAGTVVDPDGRPVALAEIELAERRAPSHMRIEIGRRGRAPRTLSGPGGEFRIGGIDPEPSYDLRVRADEFAPATLPLADLEPYRTLSGVRVTLASGLALSGTVVDEEDRPLRGASIELAPQSEAAGGAVFRMMPGSGGGETSFAAETDDQGRFELRGLPAGRFELTASRPGYARRKLPGVEVAADRQPSDLGRIVLAPGQSVQGTVRDDGGRAVEDAEVFVREAAGGMVMVLGGPGSDGAESQARTDPSGWFAVGELDRGLRYDVEVRRRGYVTARASGIELPRVEPLEIVLEPASRVAGRVTDEGGEPIAGAQVSLRRTRTLEMGGRAMAMVMMEDTATDQQGRFLFEDQEPGTISLGAVASGYQQARRDDLQVPRGEHLEGVEIPLPAGAILEGRVLGSDGRAAIGASVGLVGEEQGLGGIGRDLARVGVDGNGYYRIDGLEPGPVSVEAEHPDHPRVVRDTEVRAGRNALDLTFSGGQPVSGRVSDPEGAPVGEAAVRLVPAGRAWGGPETTTAADGTFTLPGARDGDYSVWAEARGFASFDGRLNVHVAGQPVAGLEIRLDRGAALTGRVGGIEPERYAATTVEAEGDRPGSFGSGRVDHAGTFRIEHLPPGSYGVKARLQGSGRQATGQAVIEPGAGEVRVDLEFGGGVALSGTVLQADEPVAGVTVYAEGVDVDAEGWTETDLAGKFSIEGLDPGSFRVHVRDLRSGLAHTESVELATSREVRIVLPTATVSGRVRDSADRQPLAGVTLTLGATAAEGAPRLAPHTTTTDLDGRFTLSGVADGSWRLNASRKGYAARSLPVELALARSIDSLEIDLEPTEGLTLEARLPGGVAPEALLVAVLDPAGGRLVGGSYPTGESGRVRLSSVPPGEWELLVSAPGTATTALSVRAPGPPVAVELPPATGLRIEVPELAGSGTLAAVRLQDSNGRPFRSLGWSAQPRGEWTLEGGALELGALPPGSWTVTASCADGRSWSGQAVTSPGARAALTLE